MESLKPILLCIVLSGIGYLVYVALNRAPPSEPVLDSAPPWNQPATSAPAAPKSPAAAHPSLPSAPSSLVTPPSNSSSNGHSPKSSLPFGVGGGSDLVTAPPATKTPPPTSSPGLTSPNSLAPPPVASSTPPSNLAVPALISPSLLPSRSATANPPSAATDLELAREQHAFDSAMRQAQAEIQQNKLVDALRTLSPWYDRAAVPAERKAELDDLLSQLAGTVIYSREHYLQEPHVVRQGETLEGIAQQLQVPWELLAKINGIDNPGSLVAGEKLKVVRGPFHAQLNRGHNQLAIYVNDLYAGRFDVQIAGDVAQTDGTFPVTKFAADHPSNTLRQKYIILGGNLFLRLSDGGPTPQSGTMQFGKRDLDDVFDILSDRSQVTIRR